jgi:hypothetical protein
MKEAASYSVLVLFGRESPCSVASATVFRSVLKILTHELLATGCRIKARGLITQKGERNVSPRQGLWSAPTRDKWVQKLEYGMFHRIELFDDLWSATQDPSAYAAVHKIWNYGPGGYAERSDPGRPENSIVVALREYLVEDAFERLERAAQVLIDMSGTFYGSIEQGVPWDRPYGRSGRLRENMVDTRPHERGTIDYMNGTLRMDMMIPRLYRGNLLSISQFLRPELQSLAALSAVERVDRWPSGLTYVRLKREPEFGAITPPQFRQFIRFVPTDSSDID